MKVAIITILSALFFFSEFSFSVNLTPEQIKLIESLAPPLEETVTFYRWEWGESNAKKNIEAGGITPEHYQTLQSKKRGVASGKGLYLAESIYSASQLNLSTALIEVEVEKGVRILDIEANIDTLERAGITIEDIYSDSEMKNILISDFREKVDDWWVLKGETGVKFKPFSIQKTSLTDLLMAKTLNLSKNKYPFNSLDLDSHIKQRVKESLGASVNNLEDAVSNFYLGKPYFSPKEQEQALNLVLKNVRNMEDSISLFKPPEMNIRSKLKQNFLNNPVNADRFTGYMLGQAFEANKPLTRFHELLSPDDSSKLFNRVLENVSSMKDAVNFITYNDSLSAERPKGQNNFFEDKFLKQIVQKVKNLPITNIKEATSFLSRARDFLSIEDSNSIIDKTIPLINDKHDISKLLSFNHSEEIQDKITKKLFQFIQSFREGTDFFMQMEQSMSPSMKHKILDHLASFDRISSFHVSQFKGLIPEADFQYFTQALQKRQQRLNCLKGFLNN